MVARAFTTTLASSGGTGELHPLEQFGAEAWQVNRIVPVPVDDKVDVERHTTIARQGQDRPAQRIWLAHQSTDLGKVPAQRRRRVLGLIEEQPDEPFT